MSHMHDILLDTSHYDVVFFHHGMLLTYVQSAIQILLVLVGRTAVKFMFSNNVFTQLTTPEEYGAFAFPLLNCIL